MRTTVVLVPTRNQSWNVGSVARLVTSKGIAVAVDAIRRVDIFLELTTHRIIHETTAPYTPQQNGVAERKNKALKKMVNSMLSYSGLSEEFWGEAMLTACYLLNRVPNKRNKTTPYELWYKKRPNLSYLRVWGCRAVVRLPDPKRKTLGEKESRDAIFDENRFSLISRPKDIMPNLEESQRDDHSDDVYFAKTIGGGCKNRFKRPKSVRVPMLTMEFPHHLNSMQQLDLEAEVSNEEIKKRWYWTLDGLGEFSVASARKIIDDNRFSEVSTQTRWKKAVPIKVNIHRRGM
ncbi:zinc finger, CCHC-type containing protein [Tanacetum coccineum]|uniref:Zinc finger, CCHC-type containing protein n=1 Tax=Tanacetum coccineum TaxID=301880 RepID=A0ABQ5DWN0_9ASTR